MLDYLFGPGLTSISPDNKSRCLKLFTKNITTFETSFNCAKLPDVPL